MLDSIYHNDNKNTLKSHFLRKNGIILSLCMLFTRRVVDVKFQMKRMRL